MQHKIKSINILGYSQIFLIKHKYIKIKIKVFIIQKKIKKFKQSLFIVWKKNKNKNKKKQDKNSLSKIHYVSSNTVAWEWVLWRVENSTN